MLSQESTAQNHQIEIWPIDRLIFYARNACNNDAAVDRMCSSIREFGFKIPLLARSDGTVVDGHLLQKSASKVGVRGQAGQHRRMVSPAYSMRTNSRSLTLYRSPE
jgi:hypothetical protein